MNSEFVCKECDWHGELVDASFQIEMAATYQHSGLEFRQRALKVTGCTLDEDMSAIVTRCPSCGIEGTITDIYRLKFYCMSCSNEIDVKDGKDAYCSYNVGLYCPKCYAKLKGSCSMCSRRDDCELYTTGVDSIGKRIKKAVNKKPPSDRQSEPESISSRLTLDESPPTHARAFDFSEATGLTRDPGERRQRANTISQMSEEGLPEDWEDEEDD